MTKTVVPQKIATAPNEPNSPRDVLGYRFDLLPAKAMFDVSKVLHEGAQKYGAKNWQSVDAANHINHALAHIYAHLAGDEQEDNLSHAICRLLFASSLKK